MSDLHPFTRSGARRLAVGGIVILALTVVAGLFAHTHGVDAVSDGFGFNAWFGFLACVILVSLAKLLGVILKRGDRYYDR